MNVNEFDSTNSNLVVDLSNLDFIIDLINNHDEKGIQLLEELKLKNNNPPVMKKTEFTDSAINKYTSFMNTLDNLKNKIKGQTIESINDYAKVLEELRKEFLKFVVRGYFNFSMQYDLYTKMLEVQYAIIKEGYKLNSKIPYYESTIKDETSEVLSYLYDDLLKLLNNNKESRKPGTILGDLLEQIFTYDSKNIDEIFKLLVKAENPIKEEVKEVKQPNSISLEQSFFRQTEEYTVKPNKKENKGLFFSMKLKALQKERGSKENPIKYIEYNNKYYLITRYVDDDGTYKVISERNPVKDDRGFCSNLLNRMENSIRIGDVSNTFSLGSGYKYHKFVITPFNICYRYILDWNKLLPADTEDLEAVIKTFDYVKDELIQENAKSIVCARYSRDGKLTIREYDNFLQYKISSDSNVCEKGYEIFIKDETFCFRNYFILDSHEIFIETQKKLGSKGKYDVVEYIHVDGKLVKRNTRMDSNIDDGLFDQRENFNKTILSNDTAIKHISYEEFKVEFEKRVDKLDHIVSNLDFYCHIAYTWFIREGNIMPIPGEVLSENMYNHIKNGNYMVPKEELILDLLDFIKNNTDIYDEKKFDKEDISLWKSALDQKYSGSLVFLVNELPFIFSSERKIK